jgi:SRSO17 transposase
VPPHLTWSSALSSGRSGGARVAGSQPSGASSTWFSLANGRGGCSPRGVRAGEIERVRCKLDDFAGEVFASLARKDQRAKGGLYLQGLMLEGRRKSMQTMGHRLGIDYQQLQQLQQFVSSSPWPVEPVRRQLSRKAVGLIGPKAWVVDDTGFVKDGPASPGVARQYSGALGKIGNVQIGVSIHRVTDAGSCPLSWRLFMPEVWDDTWSESNEHAELVTARRVKAQIPATVRHRPKWELALEMIDELGAWGLVPPVMVGDAGYGEIGHFRTGLTERGIPYVVQVKSSTSLHDGAARFEMPTPTGKRGRPFTLASYQSSPVQAKSYAAALPADAFQRMFRRQGTKGEMASRFAARRVRPANRNLRHERGRVAAGVLAARRVGRRRLRARRLLAFHAARGYPDRRAGAAGDDPVAHRARLPRTQTRPRPGPLRRPHLPWLAPPHDPRHRRAPVHHPPAPDRRPKSSRGSLSFYETLRELKTAVTRLLSCCPYCQRAGPT